MTELLQRRAANDPTRPEFHRAFARDKERGAKNLVAAGRPEAAAVQRAQARKLRRRATAIARGFRQTRVVRAARPVRRRETTRAPRSPNRPRARARRSASSGTNARDGDPPDPPNPPHRRRCWRIVEHATAVSVPEGRLGERFAWYRRAGLAPAWCRGRSGFRACCPGCRVPGALLVFAVSDAAEGAA